MADLQTALDLASSLRKHKAEPDALDAVQVDPFFIEDPKASAILDYAIRRRKHVYVFGPTGCGKSSFLINVAAKAGRRMEIVSMDVESSKFDIIGKLVIETNEKGESVTAVTLGPVLRAYAEGKILLLEEVDMGNPDVLAGMHRILEQQSNFVTVDIGKPITVKRHPDFQCWATGNTSAWGEGSFLYAGTKPQNQAFMNRLNLTIEMDYIDPYNEIKVVHSKTGLDTNVAREMVLAAHDVREGQKSTSDRIASVISTRDLLEWAEMVQGNANISAKEAAEVCFIQRMAENDREIVRRFISNRF
jgi:cobaltochelatase CobS